jgi:hypothetical protein
MSRLDAPSFARPGAARIEGSRVLSGLPSRGPAVLPTSGSRASQVLQSRRAPTQLSLFPSPAQALARSTR